MAVPKLWRLDSHHTVSPSDVNIDQKTNCPIYQYSSYWNFSRKLSLLHYIYQQQRQLLQTRKSPIQVYAQQVRLSWYKDELNIPKRVVVHTLFLQHSIRKAKILTMWIYCQTDASREAKSSPYICIFGKPVDIPCARSLDVPDHNFKVLEI